MSMDATAKIKEILMDPYLFDGGYIDKAVDRVMDVQASDIATLKAKLALYERQDVELPELDEQYQAEKKQYLAHPCPDWSCCYQYAETECRERQLLAQLRVNKALRESHAELVTLLHNISTADWHNWEDGLNTKDEFIAWAKSISGHTAKKAEVL
jgi:phospholipase/lecithinase/hemolysin